MARGSRIETPGWFGMSDAHWVPDRGLCVTIRIHPWHPSMGIELWRRFTVRPAILKPIVWLYSWIRICWHIWHRGRANG